MSATTNNLKLTFANGNDSLDVRHFSAHESINDLFELSILAISDDPDIDITGLVGKGAIFKLETPNHRALYPTRVWGGVVAHMSQVHAQPPPGQSMYHLMIVPDLWRTTLRVNNRIYEHKDTPTIVREVLFEWKIDVVNKLKDKYALHEYVVQYGETDYDFVSRLLEDAGITYFFHQDADSGKGQAITKLVLTDKPTDKEFERPGILAYAHHTTPRFGADPDYCTTVTLTQRNKPGKFIQRDFNFRTPLLKSKIEFGSGDPIEDKYEQYDYLPGAFWWDTKKPEKDVADVDNAPNNDEQGEGPKLSRRILEAERRRRILVSFHTNATDLAPGKIVGVNQDSPHKNHPRADLAPDKKILLIETHIEGQHNGEWTMTANGVFAAEPYRPERKTPKPRIYGMQSAFVVGPPGQEIYTDEYGRVRVQFHWDREHKYDKASSCWVRVSQNWAGGSFGMMNIPRVGHEVLIGFYEGDPDRPVIMGRVYNETSPVPWTLPDNATKSGWRSNSLPTKTKLGYNELSFEDAAGKEEIHLQAENDLSYVVKSTETINIGNSRSAKVGKTEKLDVFKFKASHIGESETIGVGEHFVLSVVTDTGYEIKDKSIASSTGKEQASLTLVGGDISFNAAAQLVMRAGKGIQITSSGGDIKVQGGSQVRVNDHEEGGDPKLDHVPPYDPPAAPKGGPNGTKPVIPSGQGSFDKPGQLEDVNTDPKPPPETTAKPGAPGDAAAAGAAAPAAAADGKKTISFPDNVCKQFGQQMKDSFPGGKSQEHGGILVTDADGNMQLRNAGAGLDPKGGSWSPNRTVEKGDTTLGLFHTHPYDKSEGGYSNVSFSGQDAALVANSSPETMTVVRSGDGLFVLKPTAKTPHDIDYEKTNNDTNRRIQELVTGGMAFDAASRKATLENANKLNMEYYEGQNCTATQVN